MASDPRDLPTLLAELRALPHGIARQWVVRDIGDELIAVADIAAAMRARFGLDAAHTDLACALDALEAKLREVLGG